VNKLNRTIKSSSFANWLDHFFDSYYLYRPVNATFIGMHDHDSRLPDYSENGAGDTVANMQSQLTQLQSLPPEVLSPIEHIDRLLAEGYLKIQLWEYQSQHFHRGNPSLYTGEAVFGIMSLFLTAFAPTTVRVEAAISRLNEIPALLAQGQANVRQSPPAWTERAIRECEGALAFLKQGIDLLIAEQKITNPAFTAAAEKAAKAFVEFRIYLKEGLITQPSDQYACGDEALDLYLRQGHFFEVGADEIVGYAEYQLDAAKQYLQEYAKDFGAADPQEALSGLSSLHPTLEHYYDRYTELWNMVHDTAEEKDLLTWPDFPIRYIPRPEWTRKAAPYLYFLFYRSPAAFNRPPVHDYLVTPIDASMPQDEQKKLLQANNDSSIKLNHVIHHGSIGHHVQNWHAFRSPSRVGQIAAVDCASRIAMFCGGTMAEGWAVYATGLMSEVGFLTPLEEYAEHRSRIRMCARAIVDLRLHQGKYTLDQAAAFYEQQAGMNHNAAYGEAVKNSMFPGAAVMYLMGNDAIKQLRKEIAEQQGNRFSLREFHDRFLSYGSIPVSLIAADMKRMAENAE
jgi:uncharacterized protein (DUF885 family)